MFGGYGAAYGSDDGHPRYRNMAEKSAAALKREEEAKKKFEEAREQLERKEDLKPGTKITMELLKPSCHLTGPCWTTFLRHVRSHEGWVAKRREATAEEKQQLKETRKGKVYFVDLVFNVSKGIMENKPVTAVQGNSRVGSSGGMFGSPNDDEESSEEDGTPDEKCSNIVLTECKRKRTITTRCSLDKSFLVPKRNINNNNSVITKSSEKASEGESGVDDDGDKDENYNQGVLSASIPRKLKKSNLKKKKTDDNVIYFVRNGVTTTGENVVRMVGKCIKNINRNKRSGTKDTSIKLTTEEASLKPSSKEASLTPSTEETLMGTSNEDNFVPPSTAVIKEEILDDEIQIVEVINRNMVPIKEEVATANSEPEMGNSSVITLKRTTPSLQSNQLHDIVGIAMPRATVIVERSRDSIGREDEPSCTFSGDHNYATTTSPPPDEISVDTERRGLDSEPTVTGAAADTRGASGGRNRISFEAVEVEETWANAEEVMDEMEVENLENNQGQEVSPPHQQGDGPPPHQQVDDPPPHKEGDGQPPLQQGDGPPPLQQGDGPPNHKEGDAQPPLQQGDGPPPHQQGDGPPPHQQGGWPPPHQQGVSPPPLQQGDGPPPVDPGHPRPQSARRESNSDDNKIEIEFNAKIRMTPNQFVAVSQKVPGFLAGCRYVRN